MNGTGIEWTDFTWNPATGCYHDCWYCYAKKIVKRFTFKRDYRFCKKNHKPISTDFGDIWELKDQPFRDDYEGTKIPHPFWFEPTFHRYRLQEPLERKKPAKIFVVSMGDLFGKWVPDEWIEEVIKVTKKCPQHTFQFLTKNPERYGDFEFPSNCWLGTTIEGDNANNVFERYWGLYDKKDNIQFISFEPLLGREDIKKMLLSSTWIDWIIIGAQTGPGAVKPKEEWVNLIINKSRFLNIPVFLKDNLNWPEQIQEWPEGVDPDE